MESQILTAKYGRILHLLREYRQLDLHRVKLMHKIACIAAKCNLEQGSYVFDLEPSASRRGSHKNLSRQETSDNNFLLQLPAALHRCDVDGTHATSAPRVDEAVIRVMAELHGTVTSLLEHQLVSSAEFDRCIASVDEELTKTIPQYVAKNHSQPSYLSPLRRELDSWWAEQVLRDPLYRTLQCRCYGKLPIDTESMVVSASDEDKSEESEGKHEEVDIFELQLHALRQRHREALVRTLKACEQYSPFLAVLT